MKRETDDRAVLVPTADRAFIDELGLAPTR
jgi:hypothetical protein